MHFWALFEYGSEIFWVFVPWQEDCWFSQLLIRFVVVPILLPFFFLSNFTKPKNPLSSWQQQRKIKHNQVLCNIII